jgi:hypothetical protein
VSPGVATCTRAYTPRGTASQPVRSDTLVAHYLGDAGHAESQGSAVVQVLAITPLATGSFVIGSNNARVGNQVVFWGAQWWKANQLTAGIAPASFKGFAGRSAAGVIPPCGKNWSADPGAGQGLPSTVPQYMAVIATSSVTGSKGGITGDTRAVVIVETNPGYGPAPGHTGTGKVIAVLCGG